MFQILRERQQKIGQQLGVGACLGSDAEHGKAVGRYLEIDDLLTMEFENLFEGEAHESKTS